jgi:hypothetical protein|tara:strand:+ start:1059 stop:1205 length:147 start_codon:yes stop_codon:yes gene_type:complete
MTTIERLINLMQLEEKARTCRSRHEAQQTIRAAERAREELWGNRKAVH